MGDIQINNLRKEITQLVLLLVLSVFAIAAAADDPHPLHGTWISEQGPDGDGGKLELAIHSDGTFRMTVEEEFGGIDSWEDILSDIDSNDNGVIDEEDYRAAQERGDEDLPESWGEVLEGDINGDGIIDEEEGIRGIWGYGDLDEFDPFAGEEEMVMTMVMTGTWEAQGKQLMLEYDRIVVTINDMTMTEYFTEFYNAMFDAMFEESGLGEDEFMANILEDDDTITAETLEEFKAAIVDEALGDSEDDEQMEGETETFDYVIDGLEMIATDSFGDLLSFVRPNSESAVEAFSWGQIKAMSP